MAHDPHPVACLPHLGPPPRYHGCEHEESCLMAAIKRDWPGWTCAECSRWAAARAEGADAASDGPWMAPGRREKRSEDDELLSAPLSRVASEMGVSDAVMLRATEVEGIEVWQQRTPEQHQWAMGRARAWRDPRVSARRLADDLGLRMIDVHRAAWAAGAERWGTRTTRAHLAALDMLCRGAVPDVTPPRSATRAQLCAAMEASEADIVCAARRAGITDLRTRSDQQHEQLLAELRTPRNKERRMERPKTLADTDRTTTAAELRAAAHVGQTKLYRAVKRAGLVKLAGRTDEDHQRLVAELQREMTSGIAKMNRNALQRTTKSTPIRELQKAAGVGSSTLYGTAKRLGIKSLASRLAPDHRRLVDALLEVRPRPGARGPKGGAPAMPAPPPYPPPPPDPEGQPPRRPITGVNDLGPGRVSVVLGGQVAELEAVQVLVTDLGTEIHCAGPLALRISVPTAAVSVVNRLGPKPERSYMVAAPGLHNLEG